MLGSSMVVGSNSFGNHQEVDVRGAAAYRESMGVYVLVGACLLGGAWGRLVAWSLWTRGQARRRRLAQLAEPEYDTAPPAWGPPPGYAPPPAYGPPPTYGPPP